VSLAGVLHRIQTRALRDGAGGEALRRHLKDLIVYLSRRMIKKQQMRWNRWTVQPFLNLRTAVPNGTLEGSFRREYPDFRPANTNRQTMRAA
jgi:hypothetical protein